MIVPMRKIHVVVQKKDTVPALETLRRIGSLHVQHLERPSGETLQQRRGEVEALKKAAAVLKAEEEGAGTPQKEVSDPEQVARAVLGLSGEAAELREQMKKRRMQIQHWEPWGDFNPADFQELSSREVFLQLCAVPQEKRDQVPEGVILKDIYSANGIDRCIAISREKIELPFDIIRPPAAGLNRMKRGQKADLEELTRVQEGIREYRCYHLALERSLHEKHEVLRFEEVAKGMREEETLAVLKGFAPVEACPEIEKTARDHHWGILLEAPGTEDQVPTLLKNPRWVEWIKPVFQFIDTLPGYREKDVSFFFLVFFSIFFGMLIGDAAYGLVYFLLTAWAHKKMGSKAKDHAVFFLLYLLSGITILWGLATGTFLGQHLFPTVFQPMVPWLSNAENVQRLCFLLGVLQLSVAHAWRGVLKSPHLSFLSEAGWIMILWGMFFLAKMLVLDDAMPGFVRWLFVAGGFLVLFFTKPSWNPFKALGTDFVGIILNTISCFADLVSYIRLFAVGLATVAVADAFNELALNAGFTTVVTGLLSSVILVFGHTLNIVLGLMSVLVHGLRLNLLEFGTHLEMEWAGFRYNPFKKREEV